MPLGNRVDQYRNLNYVQNFIDNFTALKSGLFYKDGISKLLETLASVWETQAKKDLCLTSSRYRKIC